MLPDELVDIGFAVDHRKQEQFARDELVAPFDGLLLGRLQQLVEFAGDLHGLGTLHLDKLF